MNIQPISQNRQQAFGINPIYIGDAVKTKTLLEKFVRGLSSSDQVHLLSAMDASPAKVVIAHSNSSIGDIPVSGLHFRQDSNGLDFNNADILLLPSGIKNQLATLMSFLSNLPKPPSSRDKVEAQILKTFEIEG